MKKFFTLLALCAFTVNSFAATIIENPPLKANQLFVPIAGTDKKISLLDLSTISVKEFEAATGRNMKLGQEIQFKLAQRELRKSINADGTVNNKKITKLYGKMADGTSDFNIGGFALGLLLGLIGVLIAYIISDDKKRARTKWAWIGLGVAVLIYLIAFIL